MSNAEANRLLYQAGEQIGRLRAALTNVQMALEQHSDGPKVAAMRVAGNGPTIGEVVSSALAATRSVT